MTIPIPRDVRQRLVNESMRQSWVRVRWFGAAVAAVTIVVTYGLEQGRMPSPVDQSHLFSRVFQTGAENRTFDATGARSGLKRYVGEPETACRTHDGGESFDYDCVATLTDQTGCTHYYPFYVMTSSIGLLSYSLDDAEASKVLRRFKLVQTTPLCADQPRRSGA